MGIKVGELFQADERQQRLNPFADVGGTAVLHLQAQRDVVEYGAPRVERMLLKHQVVFGVGTGDFKAVDQDATRRR